MTRLNIAKLLLAIGTLWLVAFFISIKPLPIMIGQTGTLFPGLWILAAATLVMAGLAVENK